MFVMIAMFVIILEGARTNRLIEVDKQSKARKKEFKGIW